MKKNKADIIQMLVQSRTVLILVGLAIVFIILKPTFIHPTNILNMLKRMSYTAISSFGMTFLLVNGVFDMSIGSLAALVGVTYAYCVKAGLDPVVMLILVILESCFLGWLNGIITVKGKIAAFLTTLATMNIFRGLAQVIANGRTITVKVEWMTDFFANGEVGIIPTPLILMAVLFVLCLFLFYKTKFGYYCKAVGGNSESARVAGIRVDRIQITAFTFMGLLAGVSGLILTGLMNAGMPDIGDSLAMDAITAAVLGGTAISGGIGTMWGTLLGALIMSVLSTGLSLLGAQSQVQMLVNGIVIIAAILMDNALKSKNVVSKN